MVAVTFAVSAFFCIDFDYTTEFHQKMYWLSVYKHCVESLAMLVINAIYISRDPSSLTFPIISLVVSVVSFLMGLVLFPAGGRVAERSAPSGSCK